MKKKNERVIIEGGTKWKKEEEGEEGRGGGEGEEEEESKEGSKAHLGKSYYWKTALD